MEPRSPEEARILASWSKNVSAWTDAVRHSAIESRKLVTDRAVIDAILDAAPRSVLDIGCGEGWLVRQLAARGIPATGVDAIPGLVEQARGAGGDFHAASYEDLAAGKLDLRFDLAVCNFALLGKESVEVLFDALPALLNPGGGFIVQTLHPASACGDAVYADGWREGSWNGFSADFTDPAPWYFRTLGSWIDLFRRHGFELRRMREPLHPLTQKPASVIFITAPI
ncbi:MAG: class SAM-dependent methyltransferase [Nevskia sp.]|nr:class SAM-dependent methyltransferase [Nevskia sp.]